MTESLTLQPATEADLPMLERLINDPEWTEPWSFFGWRERGGWDRRFAENGLISADGGILVVRDGGPDGLGLVNWRQRFAGVRDHCWEIGIILVPASRGRGIGARAQRLLARYLLAHTTMHRIFAVTEVGNLAEARALEKAGFTREGISRGMAWRDGAWRDGVTYSLLRTDPHP